jgi:hypothetical protein
MHVLGSWQSVGQHVVPALHMYGLSAHEAGPELEAEHA